MRGLAWVVDRGAVAQLGERLPCTQEVRSSILLGSTKFLLTSLNGLAVYRNKRFSCVTLLRVATEGLLSDHWVRFAL